MLQLQPRSWATALRLGARTMICTLMSGSSLTKHSLSTADGVDTETVLGIWLLTAADNLPGKGCTVPACAHPLWAAGGVPRLQHCNVGPAEWDTTQICTCSPGKRRLQPHGVSSVEEDRPPPHSHPGMLPERKYPWPKAALLCMCTYACASFRLLCCRQQPQPKQQAHPCTCLTWAWLTSATGSA